MSVLLAEFSSPEALVSATRAVRERKLEIVDAFTPFPVEELTELLPDDDKGERLIMLAGGLFIAGLCYFLEWWTSAIGYPFNSGGRPIHSWPVFFLFPFEFGVLAAAIIGLIVMFWKTGLPEPYHAIFDSELHACSNVDAFLLALRAPQETHDEIRQFLIGQGAVSAREVEL